MANYEEGYDVEYLEWVGGAEESVYSDESRADLVADDAISAEEDAFMKGYNQGDEVVEESI
jgi:hypothetical protein